jgi:hypothetical protein
MMMRSVDLRMSDTGQPTMITTVCQSSGHIDLKEPPELGWFAWCELRFASSIAIANDQLRKECARQRRCSLRRG